MEIVTKFFCLSLGTLPQCPLPQRRYKLTLMDSFFIGVIVSKGKVIIAERIWCRETDTSYGNACTHPILSDGNSAYPHPPSSWDMMVRVHFQKPAHLIPTLASSDLQLLNTWTWWCLPDNDGPGRLDGNWFLIEVNL